MRRLLSNSGQAILEYTLLIVIVLGILFGVIYQFNDAFKIYAQKLFVGQDSYFACLIKNGILPGADNDACPKPDFSLAAGKPLPGNSGAGANGGANSKNQSANRGGSSSSSGRANDQTSGRVGFSLADNKNYGINQGANAAGKDDKKTNTGNDGISSQAGGQNQSEGSSSGSGTSGNRLPARPVEETAKEKAATTVPLTPRDMKSARELAYEKSKKKAKAQQEEESDFSFGNIFKYLIIIVLVFAIIFFLGSQFLAVSRSRKRK